MTVDAMGSNMPSSHEQLHDQLSREADAHVPDLAPIVWDLEIDFDRYGAATPPPPVYDDLCAEASPPNDPSDGP